mmetsp:Transcript_19304/g.22414  ORF Transcript_19304/g.22414 Transcript_19304/m.22414 type:complete len:207 (+) Transcript_19304:516-1136(+)
MHETKALGSLSTSLLEMNSLFFSIHSRSTVLISGLSFSITGPIQVMIFSAPIASDHLSIASRLICLTSVFFSDNHISNDLTSIGAYVLAAGPSAVANLPTNSIKPLETLLLESPILTLSKPTNSLSPFGRIRMLLFSRIAFILSTASLRFFQLSSLMSASNFWPPRSFDTSALGIESMGSLPAFSSISCLTSSFRISRLLTNCPFL